MHILLYHITASLTSKMYILSSNIWRIQRFLPWSHITTTWALFLNIFSEGQIFGMHITASCTLLYANVLLMLMRFLFLGHYIWLLRFSSTKWIPLSPYYLITFINIECVDISINISINFRLHRNFVDYYILCTIFLDI